MKKIRSNRESYAYVTERVPFVGSSMRGQTYPLGGAPHFSHRDTWLSEYEHDQYQQRRGDVTYVVYSFATPIAYYSETSGWYKVGQTFSSYSSRHQSLALGGITGHNVVLTGKRGDWIVHCFDCRTERQFTRRNEAERLVWSHR